MKFTKEKLITHSVHGNIHKFHFVTPKDSQYFIDRVLEITKTYSYITLADLYGLLGMESNYLDSKTIWTYDTLKYDMIYDFNSYVETYIVLFPEPDQYLASSSTVKLNNTPEPFNITILMDPSKDPYTTIREVIRQANEIKDRPVFITIN